MASIINKYLLCIFSYFIISLIATCYRVYCGRCFFVSKNTWGGIHYAITKIIIQKRYETVLNEAMQYSMEFDHLYQQADKAMYESKRIEGIIATFYEDVK